MSRRSYTDDDLAAAVASAKSWRGVLRNLGLTATSAGTARSARQHADRLQVSYEHFSGQRRWSDADLAAALESSSTWHEVLAQLGLSDSGGNLTAVRGRAARLSLPLEHLDPVRIRPVIPFLEAPQAALLRRASVCLAAAWFQLRGYSVMWPAEPCPYDVVVELQGTFHRIQVKTTTKQGAGSSMVTISRTRGDKRRPYDLDEIDHFFILNDKLDAYLIPIAAVAGLQAISLHNYTEYLVARCGRWLEVEVEVTGSGVRGPAPRSRSGYR